MESAQTVEGLERDEQYIFDNWAELMKAYSGMHIAVYRGFLVAVSDSFAGLSQELERQDIKPSHAAKQYLNPDKDFWRTDPRKRPAFRV